MKVKANYDLIAPYGETQMYSGVCAITGKAPFVNKFTFYRTDYWKFESNGIKTRPIKPINFIDVTISEQEADNLKNLLKANSIDEKYLGEFAWYLVKAKKMSSALKQTKEGLRKHLEDCYIKNTLFKEAESNQVIINSIKKLLKTEKNKERKKIFKEKIQDLEAEKYNSYQKYIKKAEKFSDEYLISFVRKTYNDLQTFEKILYDLSDIYEINFLDKGGKISSINKFDKNKNVESDFVLNRIKDALFERYVDKSRYTHAKVLGKIVTSKTIKNGKVVEEAKEINTLLLDPTSISYLIDFIGIDDQKQNRNKNKAFDKEAKFISPLYRFLVHYFSSLSYYRMSNFIAGLLYFSGYDGFNVDSWGEYRIGSNNQEYREYIEKRIDNDLLATIYKLNQKKSIK